MIQLTELCFNNSLLGLILNMLQLNSLPVFTFLFRKHQFVVISRTSLMLLGSHRVYVFMVLRWRNS